MTSKLRTGPMPIGGATLAVMVALAVALLAPASASAAPPATQALQLPATCADPTTGDPVGCTLELVGFQQTGGTLEAVLRVTNTVTGATQTVTQAINTQQQGGSCTILDLTLGPIDLTLLGLRIQTNEINLLITAQRGTLLGDLLCGLFFGSQQGAGGPANVLNQLLRQGMISVA